MLLDEGMRVRVLELAGDLDPDEYVKEQGPEAYRGLLDKAPYYYFWLADRTRKRFDVRVAEGRVDAWKAMLPSIERIHDRIERAAVAKDMASYLGVDEGLVLERFRRGGAARSESANRTQETSVPVTEKLLLNALLQSEEARVEVLPALREMEAVKRFSTRAIFGALFAVTASGDVLTFSNLEARLGDADKDLLSRVVFADEVTEESSALAQARSSLRNLQKQEKELRRSGLKSRIQAAERGGDLT